MPTYSTGLTLIAEPFVIDAIADALDTQKHVAEEIKEVAEELAVVHAVLETQIPGDVNHHDVGEAVARTDALEKRLNESVQALENATQVLEQEVKDLQSSPNS